MKWSVGCVVTLTRKLLYIEEIVIHVTGNMSSRRPVLSCAVLYYAAYTTWLSGQRCTYPQPAGSTQVANCHKWGCWQLTVPVVTPPEFPCLHFKAKQQVLMQTSISFTVEIINRVVFFQENTRTLKTTMPAYLSTDSIYTACCAQERRPSDDTAQLGVLTYEGS